MNFKLMTKFSKWKKVFFVFSISLFFIAPVIGKAQSQLSTTAPRIIQDWRRIGGISDRFPEDFFLILKPELNLTDDQIEAIKALVAFDSEYTSNEAHDFKESVPWDPKDKKTFLEKYKEAVMKLHASLGDEKFEDFCQWIIEIKSIKRNIGIIDSEYKKNKEKVIYDPEKIVLGVENESSYKSYKENKALKFKSKSDSDDYFTKHEKSIKLKTIYLINIYGNSVNDGKNFQERKEEGKIIFKKRKEAFDELKELYK